MKKIILNICLLFLTVIGFSFNVSCSEFFQKVYIYSGKSAQSKNLIHIFEQFNIEYQLVDLVMPSDKNLYVIFDLYNLDKNILPKYYIAYQSLDLANNELKDDYFEKLKNAIVVWDCNKNNINHYKNRIYNYFYFPENYEYADPLIRVCLLPLSTMDSYKKLVIYCNEKDSDISSHLPTLFCFGILQNPKLVVEAGIGPGESTICFSRIAEFCDMMLLGIDIVSASGRAYTSLQNAKFVCMNDLKFMDFYNSSQFRNTKIDMVFIDTSHAYEHTLNEIKIFEPLLSDDGLMAFHDSYVTPINNISYVRLNGTVGWAGGNPDGVARAIQEYFAISFDRSKYVNSTFIYNGIEMNLIHYPFCNGLTVIKRLRLV